MDLGDVADEAFCYLTTRGRVTGDPHEIEIWFAASGSTIYMLSGGGERSDWVKNLIVTPKVQVRIGACRFAGRARLVEDPDEEARARAGVFDKYDATYSGDLTGWRERSLPVAVDLSGAA